MPKYYFSLNIHLSTFRKGVKKMSSLTLWVTIGFIGQFIFGSRFVVQWIASERKKESFIPMTFWYLSILGSIIL
ncbi:MAG: lipid-A-disaccharide synthase N-terminal domain-containing protein, partial [Candidatus Anammoxibacter sp.]